MKTCFTFFKRSLTGASLCLSVSSMAQYKLTQVYSGLTKPLELNYPKDGSNRVFTLEQSGRIRVFPTAIGATSKVFLDLTSVVFDESNEMGLLGLAFHPLYAANGYFFVNYTTRENNTYYTNVVRYSVNPNDADVALPNSAKQILRFIQPYTNHNGGCLRFGPDGYLYIANGDGGSSNDPLDNASKLSSLLGKILRIDINGTEVNNAYSIPADNPFVNTPNANKEIFAYGLRNPWRFSFDTVTNLLWTGDVGQGYREEIDIIEKGKNYGWRTMEGFSCRGGAATCNKTGLQTPVIDYEYSVDDNYSVTGGYVYRGNAIPALKGKYIFGDYASGRIYALTYLPGTDTSYVQILNSPSTISSFGVDKNGELYVVGHDNGIIYRIESTLTTDLDENNTGREEVKIHPNPFQNNVTLILPSSDQVTGIKLLDASGGLIQHVTQSVSSGKSEITLAGESLKAGMYLVEVESVNSKKTYKVIKQ